MNKEKILEILNNCYIDDELTEENCYYQIGDQLDSAGVSDYEIFNGVSKCVIIPEGADYVLKVPIRAREIYDYWDDELEEYVEYDETQYEPLEGAQYGDPSDYCRDEVIIYERAKHAGVAKAFCKTKFFGKTKHGGMVYQQQRATTFASAGANKKAHIPTNNYTDRQRTVSEKLSQQKIRQFNLTWQIDAIDYYGEAFFMKLMKFLKDNYLLSDLHTENIGYIDKKPVLIDFSAYNG